MKRFNLLFATVLGVTILVGGGMMISRCSAQEASLVPPLNPAVTVPAIALGDAYAAVAAHVQPLVVSVYSEKMVKFHSGEFGFPFEDDFFQQFFGRRFQGPRPGPTPKEFSVPQRGMGSGMIIDKDGFILTNHHVVKDVDEIKVQFADKRRFEAEIVGLDPKTDVAVIRIKGQVPRGLPVVEWGDSNTLKVGELVMAIGAPFGLMQTVTTGIISAKGRSDVGITDFEDFLQTDAPINPGNSGGPLVNMRGEVIGMNTAIASRAGQSAGVGFSIPSNLIKSLLPTLIKGRKITRGQLGVIIQEVTKELAGQFSLPPETKGALVAQVNPGSAADKAGIKAGDVIIRFGGVDIQDTRELRNRVAAAVPGTQVKVVILREGKERALTVTIGEMQAESTASKAAEEPSSSRLAKLGLTVDSLTQELARKHDLLGKSGVVITEVEPGSPSSLAGLQEGDLIVEANRHAVSTVEELERAVGKAKAQEGILLLVKRKEASLFVVLQVP